ncbi:peptidylprolyl isomerase [Maricaulis sp.]|uniref:peptidylprolyl isomerase n=1 Tax=Maricaulis sp. TaxID=1486257 RepID=UPI002B26BE7B|nr:peptidylprolyl isomerase [Maricaulis sp.]
MLSNFRAFAQSPLALVIIVLLVLSFAIAMPGAGGIFTGSGDAVVVVGPERISQREMAVAFNREVSRLQEQNPDVTREMAREEGIAYQVLQQQISMATMAARARDLGLAISNVAIVSEVADVPAFRNPVTDRFDRDTMAAALQRSGMTEDQFARDIEGDLLRSQLMATLAGFTDLPDQIAATRYLVAEEQRRMTGLVIDASTADEIEDPSDDVLQAFVDETPGANGEPLFTRPEYRAITLVRFQLEDFIRDVDVDEATLREVYDYEIATNQIGTPALRSFTQLTASDQAVAEDAASRLSAGESPAAIATELGLDAPLAQTDVQQFEIPDEGLGETVFAMSAGEARAIAGRFGWSAVIVDTAVDAVQPTFEDERPRLQADAARAQATDDMYDAISAFETVRATGASLEIAAEESGTPLEVFQPLTVNSVDADLQYDVERYEALAPEILPAAFDQLEGFETNLESYNETDFYTLRVDEVIPSRPFELDEVREQAERRWRSIQIDTQLQARAEDALAQLEAGLDMETVSLIAVGRTETATLKRGQTAGGFTRNAVSLAFTTEPGTHEMLQIGEGRYLVFTVDEIIPADIAAAPAADLAGIESSLTTELGNDVVAATREYLIRDYGITDESVDGRLYSLAIGETDPSTQR